MVFRRLWEKLGFHKIINKLVDETDMSIDVQEAVIRALRKVHIVNLKVKTGEHLVRTEVHGAVANFHKKLIVVARLFLKFFKPCYTRVQNNVRHAWRLTVKRQLNS